MKGYGASSYGDGMADVYDEWYDDISDVDATTEAIIRLTSHGDPRPARVLELGVGTGRLAIPLAASGVEIMGIDASTEMLRRLDEKARAAGVKVVGVLGDMAGPLPAGPFDAVFVAYNTFFGLLTELDQQRCLAAVSEVLTPTGVFAVEAFVPNPPDVGSAVEVKTMTADRVVLSVSQFRPSDHVAEGQFVEFTVAGGVRLRPWSVRYATPEELDAMAAAAGLAIRHRWEEWDGSPFTPDSAKHVTVYSLSLVHHSAP